MGILPKPCTVSGSASTPEPSSLGLAWAFPFSDVGNSGFRVEIPPLKATASCSFNGSGKPIPPGVVQASKPSWRNRAIECGIPIKAAVGMAPASNVNTSGKERSKTSEAQPTKLGRFDKSQSPSRTLPSLIFVLTLGIFQLARPSKTRNVITSQILRKTMKTKHSQRSFSEGGALSSVEEHFLHTEGVAGSSPAARTIQA